VDNVLILGAGRILGQQRRPRGPHMLAVGYHISSRWQTSHVFRHHCA